LLGDAGCKQVAAALAPRGLVQSEDADVEVEGLSRSNGAPDDGWTTVGGGRT